MKNTHKMFIALSPDTKNHWQSSKNSKVERYKKVLQTVKLNIKNGKTRKMKVW